MLVELSVVEQRYHALMEVLVARRSSVFPQGHTLDGVVGSNGGT
jgi:hypothetical protein